MPDSTDPILKGLIPGRPLMLVDADEVLLRFVERLEHYLADVGYELRLTSFRLAGNIYHRASGDQADGATVKGLIAGFFDACADDVPPVDGAADALAMLSDRYQIIVLSNVPAAVRARRQASLKALGLDYPVVANAGEKGPLARAFADAAGAQTVFIDDLPPQHASVAKHAPAIHRIHFVADARLNGMIDTAEHAHARFADWPALARHLRALMEG